MHKQNKQSLDNINFVQDITPKNAANYSGGIGRVNDGNNDPDIILYEDRGLEGASRGINAVRGDGIPNLVDFDFNDKTSSILLRDGVYRLYRDSNYRNPIATLGNVFLTRGVLELEGDNDNTISSVKRIV